MNNNKRPRVAIVRPVTLFDFHHCGHCCSKACTNGRNQTVCDCELQKIPLYVEYERGAKAYAYECLCCKAINKIE